MSPAGGLPSTASAVSWPLLATAEKAEQRERLLAAAAGRFDGADHRKQAKAWRVELNELEQRLTALLSGSNNTA